MTRPGAWKELPVSPIASCRRLDYLPGSWRTVGPGVGPSRMSFQNPSMKRLAIRLPFFYGWVIIAVGFVTVALGVSARTAFSLMFPPIVDEFGWDRGLA